MKTRKAMLKPGVLSIERQDAIQGAMLRLWLEQANGALADHATTQSNNIIHKARPAPMTTCVADAVTTVS